MIQLGLAGAAGMATCARASTGQAETDYALDGISRKTNPRGPVSCPDLDLELYRGTHIPYSPPAKVFVGFKPHLAKMEQVARDLGMSMYGRPPARLVHLGTYNCRRISAFPDLLSEHALGNAIDVAGFDFGRLRKDQTLPHRAPNGLRHRQAVRMLHHWNKSRGAAGVHGKFLRELARRLIAQRDIFRDLLGPAWPGHHNHFHFDMAPYRMVEVFDDSPRAAQP